MGKSVLLKVHTTNKGAVIPGLPVKPQIITTKGQNNSGQIAYQFEYGTDLSGLITTLITNGYCLTSAFDQWYYEETSKKEHHTMHFVWKTDANQKLQDLVPLIQTLLENRLWSVVVYDNKDKGVSINAAKGIPLFNRHGDSTGVKEKYKLTLDESLI